MGFRSDNVREKLVAYFSSLKPEAEHVSSQNDWNKMSGLSVVMSMLPQSQSLTVLSVLSESLPSLQTLGWIDGAVTLPVVHVNIPWKTSQNYETMHQHLLVYWNTNNITASLLSVIICIILLCGVQPCSWNIHVVRVLFNPICLQWTLLIINLMQISLLNGMCSVEVTAKTWGVLGIHIHFWNDLSKQRPVPTGVIPTGSGLWFEAWFTNSLCPSQTPYPLSHRLLGVGTPGTVLFYFSFSLSYIVEFFPPSFVQWTVQSDNTEAYVFK